MFPQIDYWLERIKKEEVVPETSTAADGFLDLLVQMRVVFLQDSVIMREKFPDHFLWCDPLFQDELYLQFESNLKNALANSDVPRDLLLQRAVPLVETHLSDLNTQVSHLSNQVQALTSLVQGSQSFSADVFRQLEPFLSVNNQARLMMKQWNRVVTEGATLNVRINQPGSNKEFPSSSLFAEATKAATPAPAPASGEEKASTSTTLPHQFSFSLPAATALAPQPLPSSQLPASSEAVGTEGLALTVQAFKHAETLPALWRIWFNGLPGFHPVCELDRVYGVKN